MNGVLGMTALLSETILNTEQQEYLEVIHTSGENLLAVINDILDFSKIESGSLELDQHTFELRNCVEDIMDLFSVKAAEKNLDLIYQIDPQIPAQIIADGMRLRQILINLVANATKFTDKGEIFINVKLVNQNSQLLEIGFEIKDTGIGIPADKLSRLFKAFSQVDSSTTRKYGGTGLGLVISARLVDLMGGEISVQSKEGEGTVFSFTVKCEAGNQPIKNSVNNSLIDCEGKKILIIDDNKTNLRILKTQLEHWNLSVITAMSGREALFILNQNSHFDLVITDMQMPEMSGVDLAINIKDLKNELPIILLSSIGDETKKKYSDLFAAILTKPVKQSQLFKVVQAELKRFSEPLYSAQQPASTLLSKDFALNHPLEILIVEDNLINQKLILKILSKLGYTVDLANHGQEALDRLREKNYEVILMDMQMPVLDGIETTQIIRRDLHNQPIIIALTANALSEDREKCLNAGMDDYLSKPINIEELLKALKKAFELAAV